MVDLLRFVRDLAGTQGARDRFRADPGGVLEADVDDADDATGEDVEAVAAVVAGDAEVPQPVRPVGAETPRDAALRVLVGLCDALDGPAVEPVTLPHREMPPDPPMPDQIAQGGGEPVPTEPPGSRWLHPVIPNDED
ncbi:MAG TPA: hypothetical protein VFV42_09950 [Acidimicrobiales bacterium]|nr:hypothetical protein [Acidimicrobiales bacterium]